MSLSLIESQIRRFLSSREPEVVCITGPWGVGKTFAWNKYLRDAAPSSIGLSQYAYVSLFGLNSIEQLKLAVFENSVTLSASTEVERSAESLLTKMKNVLRSEKARKLGTHVAQIPLFADYIGGLGPLWFATVKETIICVDDIERRGADLRIRDVLGLVSMLKEQRKCKIALILNDDELTDEDKGQFRKYFEKTVDAAMRFQPSPQECARIALDMKIPTNEQLAAHSIALGISNIRVIKKIERAIRQVEPLLRSFESEVLQTAVHSLTLLGWSIYEPGNAPPLEFIKARQQYSFTNDKKEQVSDKEAAWNALLEAYRFVHMDQFDAILAGGIQQGYFDPSQVAKGGTELNDTVKADKRNSAFSRAWDMFHDSFADNQAETLATIETAFFENIENISPLNLGGTVSLFKELGHAAIAKKMIEAYVTAHGDDRTRMDLRRYPFAFEIHDEEIAEAFEKALTTTEEDRDPEEVLLSMRTGWNDEELAIVQSLQPDDYYAFFKKNSGDRLRQLISAALQFDRITNATSSTREISSRAKRALQRIAEESPINARRVKKYGVNLESSHGS